jgi:hypothetical protein
VWPAPPVDALEQVVLHALQPCCGLCGSSEACLARSGVRSAVLRHATAFLSLSSEVDLAHLRMRRQTCRILADPVADPLLAAVSHAFLQSPDSAWARRCAADRNRVPSPHPPAAQPTPLAPRAGSDEAPDLAVPAAPHFHSNRQLREFVLARDATRASLAAASHLRPAVTTRSGRASVCVAPVAPHWNCLSPMLACPTRTPAAFLCAPLADVRAILLLRSVALPGDCHNADTGREHESCGMCTRALFGSDGAVTACERHWRHIVHCLCTCTACPELVLARAALTSALVSLSGTPGVQVAAGLVPR